MIVAASLVVLVLALTAPFVIVPWLWRTIPVRRLPSVLTARGATWAAFVATTEFSDLVPTAPRRRSVVPPGYLVLVDDVLEWLPGWWPPGAGVARYAWPVDDLQLAGRWHARRIGLGRRLEFLRVLAPPSADFVVSVYGERGERPAVLSSVSTG